MHNCQSHTLLFQLSAFATLLAALQSISAFNIVIKSKRLHCQIYQIIDWDAYNVTFTSQTFGCQALPSTYYCVEV